MAQDDAEAVCNNLAAAFTKDVHGGAVRHDHGAHVLNHAGHPLARLLGDGTGAFGHFCRSCLRRGDDEQLCIRDELRNGQRDIAGTRRQVEEENIEIAPEYVRQELLQCAVEHRSAPDDGRVTLHELPNRDVLNAVGDGRQQHFIIKHGGAVGRAEQAGHGVAVNIGIDNAHLQALIRQRCGQVDGHRGLADATLTRRHRKDAGRRIGLRKRNLGFGLAAAQLLFQLAALLIAHRVHGHGNLANAVDVLDRGAGIGLDGGLHGAARDGQINANGDVVSFDIDRFHHIQFGDGAADFWILYVGKSLAYD